MDSEKKIRVVQFVPYFPPHRGGVETVAEEWSAAWVAHGYGDAMNAVFSVGQPEGVVEYIHRGCRIIVIPAFDIVHGFPIPRFWTRAFWRALRTIFDFSPDIVQTHTRFFLSSLLGGLCARWWHIPWVHVEHGSGFVVSRSRLIAWSAYLYDRILGRWTISRADRVITISGACRDFVLNIFKRPGSEVIFRGIDIPRISRISTESGTIRLLFVGRLVGLK